MSDLRLRARSSTELVDAAFSLYRRNPLPFMLLTAFAYAPLLVLRLVLLGMGAGGNVGARTADMILVLGIVSAILYLITYTIMSAGLVRLASQSYLGQPVDVGDAVRDAMSRLGTIIGGGIVKALLMGVGFLFFVVGGVYVTARLFAINEAIVLEDRGVGAALTRSGELSRGRKWHVLGTLGLVAIVYVLIFMAVTVAATLSGSTVVAEVATTAYVVVAYPLFGITETLLYYDARIRAEGYDIELMTGALGTSAPAAENAAR